MRADGNSTYAASTIDSIQMLNILVSHSPLREQKKKGTRPYFFTGPRIGTTSGTSGETCLHRPQVIQKSKNSHHTFP